MGVTLTVLALVAGGVVVAAIYAVNAARRGVAASLVGEIAEILNVIEAHDVENGLANAAIIVSPLLSPFSPIIYQSQAARIGLLGAHRARLIASFYSSVRDLSDELRALSIEIFGGGTGGADEIHFNGGSGDVRSWRGSATVFATSGFASSRGLAF